MNEETGSSELVMQEKMSKVKSCYIWTNGMVLSFDEKGEQIPEAQGFILDVAEKLKEMCDENTVWSFGDWSESFFVEADFSWFWKKKSEDRNDENKSR